MSDYPKLLQCPKCQNRMTPGYQVTDAWGAPWTLRWATKIPRFLGVAEPKRAVLSYCCETCGYLESYSLPAEVELKSVLEKP
jgi:hypothetical protein